MLNHKEYTSRSDQPLGIVKAGYRVIASVIDESDGQWIVLGASTDGNFVTWRAYLNAMDGWAFVSGNYYDWIAPSGEKLIAAAKDMERRRS